MSKNDPEIFTRVDKKLNKNVFIDIDILCIFFPLVKNKKHSFPLHNKQNRFSRHGFEATGSNRQRNRNTHTKHDITLHGKNKRMEIRKLFFY